MINFTYKDRNFEITKEVIETLVSYKQIKKRYESGGILIASINKLDYKIEVNDCTTPVDEDKRSFFELNDLKNIMKYLIKSGKKVIIKSCI